ncbi:MAG: sialate O-acetylesterase [Akkermansiaceae bacterium]|jgi:hypothetical protein|nr:sialate O-acetylesterase [Luteolibacter sp.]
MKLQNPLLYQTTLGLVAFGLLANPLVAQSKEADVSKPVKVFIIMGQSNTLEMGKVAGADKDDTLEGAVKKDKMYPFLVDEAGAWTVRKDVRNVGIMQKGDSGNVYRNDWLTVSGNKIGIELGIGHKLGDAIEEPVMILKSSIGNRGLSWDLLPPGSESWEYVDPKDGKTYVYAGYKQSPARWEKGTTPAPIGWYAGKQYDDDVANAKKVLSEIGTYYPGATKYEVAGFFWWQGEKDCGDASHSAQYEKNLINLIAALRKDFNAPNAKFVLGTLGEATKDSTGNTLTVYQAHMAVDGETGKHPQFKGSVSTVYTNPISMGGSGNGHYGGNAKTYTNVGVAMGEAMTKLLKK